MKTFLRVFIVLIILVGLGFGAYAIFFKPANGDAVFLALAEINNEEQETNYGLMLESIGSNKFNPNAALKEGEEAYDNAVKNAYNKVLSDYREMIITESGNSNIQIGEATHYDYPRLKEYLDEVFNYYFGYSQATSKKVPKSALNDIKDSVNDYEDSLNNLNEKFKSIESLQNKIIANKKEDLSIELASRYQLAVKAYRIYINSYANLIENTKNFVNEYVFDGESLTDRDSLIYELMIKSLQSATAEVYDFNNLETKALEDDKMTDAYNFVKFAMEDSKNDLNIYHIDGGSVLYNNKVYRKTDYLYLIPRIQFEISGNNLYFSGTQINVNIVDFSVNGSILNIGDYEYTASDINGKMIVSVDNLIYNASSNKVSLYKTYCTGAVDNWRVSSPLTVNVGTNSITFGDGTQEFVVSSQAFNVFTLSSEETYFENIYNVNTEGKVVKYNTSSDSVELSTTEVSDAKYYGNDSFSKIAVGEKATYDDMIKAYKEILKTDAKEIENMMNLTLKEKQNFVKGDSAVASKFLQPLQDEIRLILACCGFIAEEV